MHAEFVAAIYWETSAQKTKNKTKDVIQEDLCKQVVPWGIERKSRGCLQP